MHKFNDKNLATYRYKQKQNSRPVFVSYLFLKKVVSCCIINVYNLQCNKLKSTAHFSARHAHDLNTNRTVLVGYEQVMTNEKGYRLLFYYVCL